MRRPLPALLAVALLAALPLPSLAETDADRVAARLAGTWDSRDQAIRDPGLRQIRMIFAPVPKSRLGAGAPVLYFEEALLATPDQPLRQAFLRLEAEEGTGRVLLKSFEPKEGASVSGKWRDPEDLALFGSGDVRERPGCAIALRPRNDWWEGSTVGTGCPFARDGARTLTLEIALGTETLAWWERGLGADGRQVWGPPKAPLLSRRSKEPPVDPIPTRTATPIAPATPPSSRMETRDLTPISAPVASGRVETKDLPPMPPASSRRAPSIVVRGLGADRAFGAVELSRLRSRAVTMPGAEGKAEKRWSGIPLLAVLKAAGLVTDGMPARRVLAPTVVVATGSDGYAAAFAVEELIDEERGPLVAADPEAGGPFRIVSSWDRIRAVRSLVSLEVRTLAVNRPEEDRPATPTPSASPRPPRS